MGELAWTSVAELARMVGRKEVSPREVVQAHLERIAALDGTLRAFITVCADAALAEARAAEAALAAGRPVGPLHGVPVGLKDLFETRGVLTTAGSRILGGHVPTRDAAVVERLRAVGAIVLGKLNMHEFAYGAEGWNEAFGDVRNPWDAAVPRIPGGSSSGSGAAVAAGLCPAALGSDTGGSIRIPASLCGITGLKPTYGRVSRGGVIPLAWSMDHVGPMARTAADCALLLQAIAGHDPADEATAAASVPDYAASLTGEVRGLRVGLLRGYFVESCLPEVVAAVDGAAKTLEGLGARVEPALLPDAEHVAAAFFAVLGSESLAYHATWFRTRAHEYSADVRARLGRGAFVTGMQYVRAQQLRRRLRDGLAALFTRHDVLLAPTTPVPAPTIAEREVALPGGTRNLTAALIALTSVFSFAGFPVCSVPCGLVGGLPVGMQVVGRPFDEATVLRAADAYQRTTDWHRRRPPLGG
jgi:aspartyl-tRNA(Asn)/glutamyl-tRNA(Gln) amidotransferase subunit A